MGTNISWTDDTWNPIVGCSIASKGCSRCHAMRMAWRQEHGFKTPHYAGTTKKVNGNPVWTGKLTQAPKSVLMKPYKRKKPTMYFVNSMSDLFHEDIPDEWIDEVFGMIANCPQHTFQILTKRAERMQKYFASEYCFAMIEGNAQRIYYDITGEDPSMWFAVHDLPNVWLGVSVEDQKHANERIPHLLKTPAAIRFLSLEPQLEEINLEHIGNALFDREAAIRSRMKSPMMLNYEQACNETAYPIIDWVIQGCESGHKARPFNVDWAYSMRDQCAEARVPYFLKQIPDGQCGIYKEPMLDGVHHLEFPKVI